MSNVHFPELIGRSWDIIRKLNPSTIVQSSANRFEVRINQGSQPQWEWEVPHEFLRSQASYSEYQALAGFVAARMGRFDSFLYRDHDDCIAVGQVIGVGNGTITKFQLARSFGESSQFIYEPNASYHAINIYVNGLLQNPLVYTMSANGLITFGSAPGAGTSITADFGFDWRVRLSDDSAEFKNFLNQYYDCGSLKFINIRQ